MFILFSDRMWVVYYFVRFEGEMVCWWGWRRIVGGIVDMDGGKYILLIICGNVWWVIIEDVIIGCIYFLLLLLFIVGNSLIVFKLLGEIYLGMVFKRLNL